MRKLKYSNIANLLGLDFHIFLGICSLCIRQKSICEHNLPETKETAHKSVYLIVLFYNKFTDIDRKKLFL